MAKKILLADDSVTIQKIVELTFEGEGFDLDVVADGHEALKQAEASPPDIILADLTMPGLSGIELCRKIREHPDLSPIPVILLTNSFEDFNRSDGDDAGISAYVEKPFESQALIDQVQELLSGEVPPVATGPAPEERLPPADEVDLISEEVEEILLLEEVAEEEVEAPALEADDVTEEPPAVEELTEEVEVEAPTLEADDVTEEPPAVEELAEVEVEAPALEADDVTEEPPAVEEVAEVEVEAPALEADDVTEEPPAVEEVAEVEVEAPALEADDVTEEPPAVEELAGEEELEAPSLEVAEEPEEIPEPAVVTAFEEEPEELYEPEIEPAPPALISMMDSTMAALGLAEEEEEEVESPLEDATAEVAAAGAALEEVIGESVRSYMDYLINQAVEQLTPTITEKVIERLKADFPPIAERIIREEIEKLKRGG